jgi:L-alanine-DL-glutamate epimerase-like enolase superfamily enzyme
VAGFSAEVYSPIPAVQGGYITLDDTPGWGVEILPSFLERAARQVTGLE